MQLNPSSRSLPEPLAPLTPSIVRQAAASAAENSSLVSVEHRTEDQAAINPQLQRQPSAMGAQRLADDPRQVAFESPLNQNAAEPDGALGSIQSVLMQLGSLVAGAPSRSLQIVGDDALNNFNLQRNLLPSGHLKPPARQAENAAASQEIQAETHAASQTLQQSVAVPPHNQPAAPVSFVETED